MRDGQDGPPLKVPVRLIDEQAPRLITALRNGDDDRVIVEAVVLVGAIFQGLLARGIAYGDFATQLVLQVEDLDRADVDAFQVSDSGRIVPGVPETHFVIDLGSQEPIGEPYEAELQALSGEQIKGLMDQTLIGDLPDSILGKSNLTTPDLETITDPNFNPDDSAARQALVNGDDLPDPPVKDKKKK